MSKKIFALLGVMALLVALLPSAVLAAPKLPDYKPVDVGPELRTWEATPERIAPFSETEAAVAQASTPYTDCILDTKVWMSLNDFTGQYFFTTFYLVAESTGAELWVQASLAWPAGDPRPTPVVTCEQAAYLVSEFDNNIFPVETDFFGSPDSHDGSFALLTDPDFWAPDPIPPFLPSSYENAAGRQVVLVSNIRDDNYYDSTYPNYIAGFYSPSFEAYFDRNIMSIDAYDWANRVGPDGSRPYLYESVFAHEYQHLLHDDYDSDEESWINEGLSMFSEYLTGYVVNEDNYTTFQQYPENSLVVWGDQGGREIVADYGMVFLYQMYQYEKFGQEFIQYEFHNQDNSIASINSTLAAFNIQKDFGDLYHDFAVAVLIDSKQANYRYGFELLDVGIDIGTPTDPNPDAYDTPGAPPWGSDYVWIEGNPKELGKISFNGVDLNQTPTSWTSDGEILYGGSGDEVDNWAIFSTTGGGTLTFDTVFDIEYSWDYGFVQVSTDGGHTWTSLSNADTCSELASGAYPTVIANVPGFTGVSGYGCNDPYAADPYPTAEWINTSFDLGPYAGQEILVAFRYVTDWAFNEPGWYIDNISVDGTLISDGADESIFQDITELFPVDNDFTVTFVGIKESKKGDQYKIHTTKLDEVTEDGILELNKVLSWSDKAVMIVTFDAPEGFTKYADYSYNFTYTSKGPKK